MRANTVSPLLVATTSPRRRHRVAYGTAAEARSRASVAGLVRQQQRQVPTKLVFTSRCIPCTLDQRYREAG